MSSYFKEFIIATDHITCSVRLKNNAILRGGFVSLGLCLTVFRPLLECAVPCTCKTGRCLFLCAAGNIIIVAAGNKAYTQAHHQQEGKNLK